MAYRSWLKDVRRLEDLANTLHHFPHHHKEWDREWEYDKREIAHIQNPYRPANLDPAAYRFFEGSLHDGYILGVERIQDRLELSIAYDELAMFCDQFFAEIEEDRDTVISPVRLTFEGVNYVNAVRTDPEGWLKWDDWTHWHPVEEPGCADMFVRGYFYEQDGKVQWVGHFHKWVTETRLDPYTLFLLVDCDRVTAKPESERALRKRMGDDCYDAWLYIQSLPREEQWLANGHLQRFGTFRTSRRADRSHRVRKQVFAL